MMPRVIGLAGFKGSGKDTAGHMLRDRAGYQLTSFAANVKSALCPMFGWQPHMMEGVTRQSREWREKPDPYWSQQLGQPITPREIMQRFGTDLVRRHLHNDFWAMSLERQIRDSTDRWVVTDVRFPNEIAMIKRLGGQMVWIRRDPLPTWFKAAAWLNRQPACLRPLLSLFLPDARSVHISERAWIGHEFDFVIHNNGSTADLSFKLRDLLAQLAEKPGSI